MFILSNFLMAIARVLDLFLTLYLWVIIIAAIITWVSPDPFNPVVRFLRQITEPVLRPLRRIVPTYRMGIDISPILAIAIIIFLQVFVVQTLYQVGYKWRSASPGVPGHTQEAPQQPSELPPF